MRCAGFARGRPAIEVGQLSSSVQNDAFHQPPKGRRGFRTNHAPRLGGNQRTLRGQNLIVSPQFCNHMRLVESSSIRDGRNRADKLDGRDADLLPQRNRSNGNGRPVLQPPHETFALTGQIHSRKLAKSERADIVVKFRRSQQQRNLDCANVARLRQDVGDSQQAKRLMVANAVSRDVHRAILAIEDFLRPDDALIESRRNRD